MAKVTVHYAEYFRQTMQRLREDGLLLVTADREGKPNVMTIGWGTIGSIWGRPVFVVLVRPSRFSYSRLEENPDFTVNVPSAELAAATAHCGKVSGRDRDKFRETGLTAAPARQVRAPIIQECVVHYECRTIHRNDLAPSTLAQTILDEYYPRDDFHRIYFGEILACYAEEDASERLRVRGGPLTGLP
ncbi:MAG: flavin reductase family protein [Bryobacterales bacterium]|nr:flavin reductase family protein [Bryobacteraceae bacterium]MDW8131459.1 flavin reductase family protein [Bryobacterales bacterium]